MRKIILSLDEHGHVPQELVRMIRESHEPLEIICEGDDYGEMMAALDEAVAVLPQGSRVRKKQTAGDQVMEVKKKPMEDRRKVPRWKIGRNVLMGLQDGGPAGTAVLEDLNFKGLCLSVHEPFVQEAPWKIYLQLEGDFPLNVETRLCWQKQQGPRHYYGLSFTWIADSDKERIYQYLNSHYAKEYKQHWSTGN